MKEYTLLLIKPRQKYKHYAVQSELATILGKKTGSTTLALPLIAALTPQNYKIKILDEDMESIDFRKRPDLVGITATSPAIERAYEIGDTFKEMGVPVIFGGPHASYNYDEVIKHANSVVIGEAEDIWKSVLSDFENGNLQTRYQAQEKPEYKTSPMPRWDLVDTSQILSLSVQASRGCPFMCEFCLTTEMFGKKLRFRDTDNVVEEIKSLPNKNFFFADDNLTINKKYAFELFAKLKGLPISWICQSSIEVADDPELLKAMHDAGCRYILVGFESLNNKSIQETQKLQNRKISYKEQIEKIHNAGIFVYGAFIVGFDHDTLDEFDNIKNFITETNIPVFMLSLLGAAAGSKLHERLISEGRWFGANPTYSGGIFPMIHYNNFSQTELFINFVDMLREAYSYKEMYTRTYNLFKAGNFNSNKLDAGASFFMKLKTMYMLLTRFKFSKDTYKRKMFNDFFKLAREKKLAMSEGIATMLMLEGLHITIERIYNSRQEYLDIIKKNDKGSWQELNKTA